MDQLFISWKSSLNPCFKYFLCNKNQSCKHILKILISLSIKPLFLQNNFITNLVTKFFITLNFDGLHIPVVKKFNFSNVNIERFFMLLFNNYFNITRKLRNPSLFHFSKKSYLSFQ